MRLTVVVGGGGSVHILHTTQQLRSYGDKTLVFKSQSKD